MKILLDTNILLEVILEQEKSQLVQSLLAREEHRFFIADFSLHSLGILLFRRIQHHVFRELMNDTVLQGAVSIASLRAEELGAVIEAGERFKLDFDDAYQYAVMDKYDLTLVSFDEHFDRTAKGRRSPEEVLAGETGDPV